MISGTRGDAGGMYSRPPYWTMPSMTAHGSPLDPAHTSS
jgi:hypothetical protein